MNSETSPDTSTCEPGCHALRARYHLAVRTGVVAGAFLALVCALLLFDFARRGVVLPLDSAQYKQLKAELAQQPEDEAIKTKLRQLDLELRRAYFRHRKLTDVGGWLVLCGVVVLLVAAKSAAVMRQRLPMPEPSSIGQDREAPTMRTARWSVAVLTMLLVTAAALLIGNFPSELPKTIAELAAESRESRVQSPESRAQGGESNAGSPELRVESGVSAVSQSPLLPISRSSPSSFPTDEELQANWPRFRGPGGLGISNHKNVPTSWDGTSGEGILWKTPVPLEGNSSPVLWGNRVFLSGADEGKREVYCFDADSGKLLWQQEVAAGPSSSGAAAEPPKVNDDTGYAAPTTAADGRRVYAIFATGDLAAYDALDAQGRQVWARSLGAPDNSYGYAASLTTYQNLLLIQFDQGSAEDRLSKMIALDGATGKTVWEAPRDVSNSWPSPIVIKLADGSHELITASDPWVIAYDPADGRELWRSKSLQGDVGPSPVFADGIIFVVNEFPGLSAIRVDSSSKGDVTETHVLWEGEDGLPDTASPLATDRYVFLLASYGILTCYEAKGGEKLWEEEFNDATFTSSPSLVAGRLYLFSREGKDWVVEPGQKACKRISEADLGEECVTTPAFRDGRIYIRGKEHLFCIGGK